MMGCAVQRQKNVRVPPPPSPSPPATHTHSALTSRRMIVDVKGTTVSTSSRTFSPRGTWTMARMVKRTGIHIKREDESHHMASAQMHHGWMHGVMEDDSPPHSSPNIGSVCLCNLARGLWSSHQASLRKATIPLDRFFVRSHVEAMTPTSSQDPT